VSPSPARRPSYRDVFAVAEFRALWLSYVLSLGGDRLALVLQHVGDDDLGAFPGEQPRLAFAHAVRAAGDDRHLVLEPHLCLPPI